MVPKIGLEPTRFLGHQILSLAWLPITPLRHFHYRSYQIDQLTVNCVDVQVSRYEIPNYYFWHHIRTSAALLKLYDFF